MFDNAVCGKKYKIHNINILSRSNAYVTKTTDKIIIKSGNDKKIYIAIETTTSFISAAIENNNAITGTC